MLLNRSELGKFQYFDREADPKNPTFRPLNPQEIDRYLINTMIGVEKYNVPSVQAQIKKLSETDPWQRVRAALKSNAPRDAAE